MSQRLNRVGLIFLVCLLHAGTLFSADQRPNILFIAIDDLRPELGCYGSPVALSPNLDKLASEGRRFDRAYCQEAICAPSRASIMTGARPDTTGITHNYVKIRELNPDIVTMPQHFGAHGYETFFTGKIYHQGDTDDRSWTPDMKARGEATDGLVELVDLFPTLCDLTGVPPVERLEGRSFAPLLEDPKQSWKDVAISQFPSPALREWAANPLSAEMRETYFGPLISEVEGRIKEQQGDVWNRELFEQHLMGYSVRSDRYRLILWRDQRNPDAEPVFIELFDLEKDPSETVNVAATYPDIVSSLSKRLAAVLGW